MNVGDVFLIGGGAIALTAGILMFAWVTSPTPVDAVRAVAETCRQPGFAVHRYPNGELKCEKLEGF